MVKVFVTKTHQKTDSRTVLHYIFSTHYGLPMPAFEANEHGKLRLTNSPLFFNLSHSGEYTAVAVSEKEIGLDIETHTARSYPAINNRLSEREKEEDFYKVWTAKEAYIKYLGTSLMHHLRTLEFYGGALYDEDKLLPVALTHFSFENATFCICQEKKEAYELCLLSLYNAN